MGEENTDGMLEWQGAYAALDKEGKKVVERETRFVIECMQAENKSRLEIGRHLAAIKEKLIPKGATGPRTKAIWGGWLKASNLGISRSTIYNYIEGWERLALQAGDHAEQIISALGRRGHIDIAPSKSNPLGKYTEAFHELGLVHILKNHPERLTEKESDDFADSIAEKTLELRDAKTAAAKRDREQRGEDFHVQRAFEFVIRSFRAADAASNKDLDAREFLGGLVGRLLTAFDIAGKQTYRPQRLAAGSASVSGRQPRQTAKHDEDTNEQIKVA
jgi:hypothetical protein